MSNPGAVIHRNVAVISCDTPVTLQETMHRLEDLALDAVPVGDRHLALPADQVEVVLERLREHGQFPRTVGERPTPAGVYDDEESEEDDE